MKNRFNRTLSILCAVMLLISAVSVWAAAEEEPASPTNLNPAEGEINPEEPVEDPQAEPVQEPAGEPEGEPGEEDTDSVDVVITKTLTVGQSWEGTVNQGKPAVLKLDVVYAGHVYLLVEGKGVWVTREKSDRMTGDPFCFQTDPETEQLVLDWEAEEGSSYLITLGPVEPNNEAKAKVTIMDKKAYEAWMETQAQIVSETEDNHDAEAIEETETDPEEGIETEQESEPEADIESESAEEDKEPEEADEQEEQPEAEPVSEENEPVQESEEPEEKPEEKQPEENEQKTEKATETKQHVSETEPITEEEKLEENTEGSVDLLDDKTLLALGYYKVQIAMSSGADIYSDKDSAAEVLDHMAVASECWLKETDNPEWAQIFTADEEEAKYLLWDKVIITMRPEKQDIEMEESDTNEVKAEDFTNEDLTENETADNDNSEMGETDEDGLEKSELPDDESELTNDEEPEESELPARYVEINSTLSNMRFISVGQPVTMTAQLFNFRDDDICSFQWQYYDRASGNYIDIEDATDSTYIYYINDKNISFFWRLVVVIDSNDE